MGQFVSVSVPGSIVDLGWRQPAVAASPRLAVVASTRRLEGIQSPRETTGISFVDLTEVETGLLNAYVSLERLVVNNGVTFSIFVAFTPNALYSV